MVDSNTALTLSDVRRLLEQFSGLPGPDLVETALFARPLAETLIEAVGLIQKHTCLASGEETVACPRYPCPCNEYADTRAFLDRLGE